MIFSRSGAEVNPVITEEFARAHNTEILSGPINLASCLDLTDQSGTVTFSSPKLFKVRGRTLLVHIKALANQPWTVRTRHILFTFSVHILLRLDNTNRLDLLIPGFKWQKNTISFYKGEEE